MLSHQVHKLLGTNELIWEYIIKILKIFILIIIYVNYNIKYVYCKKH